MKPMLVLLLLQILFMTGLRLAYSRDFSYNGAMGPDHWAEEYSSCDGKHQSPINIFTYDVEPTMFPLLYMENFAEQPIEAIVSNNGHTVIVQFKYKDQPPYITGGPYDNETYQFVQMHFHWGANDQEGSEDLLNGKQFPAESHMVFHNTKYPNYDEAIKHRNGITVLACFFSIGNSDHPGYEIITSVLPHIITPYSRAKILKPPPLENLTMAINYRYYMYIGSLTTPPCTEDVIWLEFDRPILVSEKQIERLRHLNDSDGFPLRGNFRPVQPLNNRTIYMHVELEGIPFIKNDAKILNSANTIGFIKAISLLLLALRRRAQ